MEYLKKRFAGEKPPPTAIATAETIDASSNRVRNLPLYVSAAARIVRFRLQHPEINPWASGKCTQVSLLQCSHLKADVKRIIAEAEDA
jgi:hypothetical protein